MMCPHCRISSALDWIIHKFHSDQDYNYQIMHFVCLECEKVSIKFMGIPKSVLPFIGEDVNTISYTGPMIEKHLIPNVSNRKLPLPNNLENDYVNDYNRAVKLLYICPMASATFSRRLLQHYIQNKLEIKKSNLLQEINEVVKSKKYPSALSDLFEYIRQYGNFSAHAMTNQITDQIIDVEPNEAEFLLDILDELFDYDYTRSSRIDEHKKKLNEKSAK